MIAFHTSWIKWLNVSLYQAFYQFYSTTLIHSIWVVTFVIFVLLRISLSCRNIKMFNFLQTRHHNQRRLYCKRDQRQSFITLVYSQFYVMALLPSCILSFIWWLYYTSVFSVLCDGFITLVYFQFYVMALLH